MSVAVLERVRIIEVFFLNKMYENFVRTLETVRNGQESVLERCPYREVRLFYFPQIFMF